MHCINIEIPFASPFLKNYLNNNPPIQPFFPAHFANDWAPVLRARSASDIPRRQVAEILLAANEKWQAPPLVLENIEKLKSEETLAVVTGQQAGILGGPLYTFYKIITTLKKTASLKKAYPQYDFVPVFWVAANDSDFEEISYIRYPEKGGNIHELRISESETEKMKPTGDRLVDSIVQTWIEAISKDFYDTEFKQDAIQRFFAAYHSENSYADAFAELLLSFFGKYGLVVVNPENMELRELGQPFFRQALKERATLHRLISERNKALTVAGFPPQVPIRPDQTALFCLDEKKRRVRIDHVDKKQLSLNTPEGKVEISESALLEKLDAGDWKLLPNVFLRPLFQDRLLATATYIGGPGELTYFAQLSPLYQFFDMQMPMANMRHNLTIVEGKFRKQIEKLHLDYVHILARQDNFVEQFLQNNLDRSLFEKLETSREQIAAIFAGLEAQLHTEAPDLLNPFRKTRQGMESSLQKLEGRITKALSEKHQVQVRQVEKVLSGLLPNGNYQEREVTMLYFCIKYGLHIVDEIMTNLPDTTLQHSLVIL